MNVRCVLFVNARGEVVSARPLSAKVLDERTKDLLVEAASRWRVQPATVRGRGVADWLVVEVRLLAGGK